MGERFEALGYPRRFGNKRGILATVKKEASTESHPGDGFYGRKFRKVAKNVLSDRKFYKEASAVGKKDDLFSQVAVERETKKKCLNRKKN